MNKKTFIILSCVIIALLLLVFVLKNNTNKDQVNTNNIKIGYIGPLTGQLAGTIGIPHKEGLELGAKDYGLNVVFEDDQGDKKNSVNAVNKLLMEKTNILVCPMSGGSFAIAPVVAEKNALLISTGANPNIAAINENTFRFFINTKDEAVLITSYIKDNLPNTKTIGVIYRNDEYGISGKEAIEKESVVRGINVVGSEAFEINTTDIKTHILKIVSKKPDAFFIGGVGPEIQNSLKTLRDLGYEGKIFTNMNGGDPSISQELRDGLYFTDFNFDENNSSIKEFADRIRKEFNREQVFANIPLEYSVAQIIKTVSDECADDISCWKKTLVEKEFETILGKIKFDAQGDASSKVLLKQYTNNTFVIVK